MTSTEHPHPDTLLIFETKTGFCHVLPDKIVLTRDGIVGGLATIVSGNTIARSLILYGILSVVFIVQAIDGYRKGNVAMQIVPGLLAAALITAIVFSLNHSATPVIERSSIRKVTFRKAIPGVTRAHFVIRFENNRGKLKKRLILLPGSLSGGPAETEKAVRIMTEEGLIGQG